MRKMAIICLAMVGLLFAAGGSNAASTLAPVDPYADEVVDFWGGADGFLGGYEFGSYNIPVSPDIALGPPDGHFVSITPGDWIIFKFTDNTMFDGPGPDLAVREIGNNHGQERAEVWVSSDGVQFTSLGIIASAGPDTNPTIYLDLAAIGFTETVRYVKVSDGVGGSAPGFDLDALWAVNAGAVTLDADIDFDPDTLNLGSKGRWATVYIELPDGYDPADIDASTVLLEDTVSPVQDEKFGFVSSEDSYVVDHDGDGIMERMFKFLRAHVHAIVTPGTYNFKVSGELEDGTEFEGYSDTIKVIDPALKGDPGLVGGVSSGPRVGISSVPSSSLSSAGVPVSTDTVQAPQPESASSSSPASTRR